MKKIALILLAIMLCLSLCLTSCDTSGANEPQNTTDPANAGNNGNNNENNENNGSNGTPAAPLTKDNAIKVFNEFKLDQLLENSKLTGDDFSKLLNELAFGADFSATNGEEVVTGGIALKDGLLYTTYTEPGEEKDEAFIYIGDGLMTTFAPNAEGVWVKVDRNPQPLPNVPSENPGISTGVNPGELGTSSGSLPIPDTGMEVAPYEPPVLKPTADLSEDSVLNTYLAKAEEIVAKLVLPKLGANDITEKDGMFVLNNAYLLKLIEENVVALSDGTIEEADLNQGMQKIEDTLDAIGLELAFAGNEKALTKLSISLKLDKNSELFADEMFGDTGMPETASIVIETTDDGLYLKKMNVNMVTDFSSYEENYKPVTTFSISTKFDAEGKPSGADLTVKGWGTEYSWNIEGSDDDTDIYYMIFSDVTAKASVDFSKLTEAGATVAEASFSTTPIKAFRITEKYNKNSDDWAKTVAKAELKNVEDKMTMSGSATVKSEGANKLTISAKITAIEKKTVNVTFTGNVYMNNVLNFPTTIPEAVTAYINGANA